MKRLVTTLAIACALACAARRGATTTTAELRAPINPPENFAASDPSGAACLSPMTDPRDGTVLRLVWSSGGVGEYEVPKGRYGVGADEVLRVDCASGKAIGIAKRRKS
jgi:hypothetical protein